MISIFKTATCPYGEPKRLSLTVLEVMDRLFELGTNVQWHYIDLELILRMEWFFFNGVLLHIVLFICIGTSELYITLHPQLITL